MTPLVEYLAGRGLELSRRDLNRIVERYEWFTTARRARALVTGESDTALLLPLMFRPTVPPRMAEVFGGEVASEVVAGSLEDGGAVAPDGATAVVADSTAMHEATEEVAVEASATAAPDLIDRFIEHGGYRIVPADELSGAEVAVDVDIDPEMVSAELAEIYRAQGMIDEAEKIERILKEK